MLLEVTNFHPSITPNHQKKQFRMNTSMNQQKFDLWTEINSQSSEARIADLCKGGFSWFLGKTMAKRSRCDRWRQGIGSQGVEPLSGWQGWYVMIGEARLKRSNKCIKREEVGFTSTLDSGCVFLYRIWSDVLQTLKWPPSSLAHTPRRRQNKQRRMCCERRRCWIRLGKCFSIVIWEDTIP